MNLLVLSPTPHDAVSFYRCFGPLNMMQRQDDGLKVKLCDALDWSRFSWADVFFAQRPFKIEHLRCIQYAKRMNIPVWVDYDDNLYDVGTNNVAHKIYGDNETKDNIRQCVDLADTLTVSTTALKDVFQRDAVVVPNAFPDYLYHLLLNTPPKDPSIIWRGSATHNKDLLRVKSAILKFMDKYKEVKWSFIGYNPWFITQNCKYKNFNFYQTRETIDMYHLIANINASIAVVPLEFDIFNACKSNIAWIEQTGCGALTIAPNTHEWQKPGIVNYESDFFYDKLETVYQMDYDTRKQAVEASREYIKDKLLLSKVNALRFQVMDDLYNKSPIKLV